MAELSHHGIRGMHWGVRRQKAADGKVRGPSRSTRKEVSSDSERASEARAKAKTHGVSSLSNQELKHLNERLNLEQRYSELTGKQSTVAKVKKGQGYIREAIGVGIMAKQVHELVNSKMTSDIAKAINSSRKK